MRVTFCPFDHHVAHSDIMGLINKHRRAKGRAPEGYTIKTGRGIDVPVILKLVLRQKIPLTTGLRRAAPVVPNGDGMPAGGQIR